MNIRISEDELRFRITHDEVIQLLYGEVLHMDVPFSASGQCYCIQTGQSEPPLAWQENTLIVDRATLEAFEQRLPSREGLVVEMPVGTLILEVDVRRKKPQI